jgi:hypothetical protein
MPLINFQTDLKSLTYGRDRRSSGDSNQPYVTEEIPDSLTTDDLPVRSGPDFIIRGGLKAVSNALDDVARLGQMFIDTKSPSGLLFIAKENLLSRTSVKTQSSKGIGYAEGRINQGVYTPLSTLGQALGNGLGTHLNFLGVDPTSPLSGIVEGGLFPGAGLNTYTSILDQSKTDALNGEPIADVNRLVAIKDNVDNNTSVSNFNFTHNYNINPEDGVMISYGGGPGSVLGIGQTRIPFASDRTGINNINGKGIVNGSYQVGQAARSYANNITGSFTIDITGRGVENATRRFFNEFSGVSNNSLLTPLFGDGGNSIVLGPNGPFQNFEFSPQSGSTVNPKVLYQNNSRTFSQNQLLNQENVIEGTQAGLYPTDFRRQLYTASVGQELPPTDSPDNPETGGSQVSTVLSISPNYRNKNKDVRLNQGQPGKYGGRQRDALANSPAKNVWNYGVDASKLEALDKITAQPMYSGAGPDTSLAINDLCKFRIAAINNDQASSAVYMHFRAFLDSFSDSYNATWTPVQYVGRGEPLYNYGGFGRTITMGFTAAAQSKAELIPMYKKLNYLASTLAPDYTEAGFMRGNLVRLTVGGYLYEQPGFITSLTYDVPQETTWEIGLRPDGGADQSVKELPHMIKVSSLQFTPIHKFLSQKPNNANNPSSKYIALSNGITTNYNDEYEPYLANGDGDNNAGNNILGE